MKRINAYSTRFFAVCPINSVRIDYHLRIETDRRMMVEDLVAAVQKIDTGFHEDIADALLATFGGRQTLVAEHHGVTIETVRETPGGA